MLENNFAGNSRRTAITQALCADDPNQTCVEMGDDDFGKFVWDMSDLAHYDFEELKQATKDMTAVMKAKLLGHFVTVWNFVDDDEKVREFMKNKGGSHAVANS